MKKCRWISFALATLAIAALVCGCQRNAGSSNTTDPTGVADEGPSCCPSPAAGLIEKSDEACAARAANEPIPVLSEDESPPAMLEDETFFAIDDPQGESEEHAADEPGQRSADEPAPGGPADDTLFRIDDPEDAAADAPAEAAMFDAMACTWTVADEDDGFSESEDPLHSSEQPSAPSGSSGGLPPLVINRDNPLVLSNVRKIAAEPLADNTGCYVCHANFAQEEMVVSHAVEDVGCVDCHGESAAHRADENSVTPPEIMYSPGKIAAACQECHKTHDAAAVKVLAKWQECCPGKKNVNSILCTDCHGKHRLDKRTVRWDKVTGKVMARKVKIEESGVGSME